METIKTYLGGFIATGPTFRSDSSKFTKFEEMVTKARMAFEEIKNSLELGRPRSPFESHGNCWSPSSEAKHNGISLRQMQSMNSVFCRQQTSGIINKATFGSYISVGCKLKFTIDFTIVDKVFSEGSHKVLNLDDVLAFQSHIDDGNSIDLNSAGIIVETNYRGLGKMEVESRLQQSFMETLYEEGPSHKESDIAYRVFSDTGIYKRQFSGYFDPLVDEFFMPIQRQPKLFEEWLEEQLLKSLPRVYRACQEEGHELTTVSLMRILNTVCYLICERTFVHEGHHPDEGIDELISFRGSLVQQYTLSNYFRIGDTVAFRKEFHLNDRVYSAGSSVLIDNRILGLLRDSLRDGSTMDLEKVGIKVIPRPPNVVGEGRIVHDTFRVGCKIEFIQPFKMMGREFNRGQDLLPTIDEVKWFRDNLCGRMLEEYGILVSKIPDDILTEGVVTERNFLEFFKSGFLLRFSSDFSLGDTTYCAGETIQISKELERGLRRMVVDEGIEIDLAMAGLSVDCSLQKVCDSVIPVVAEKLVTNSTFEAMYTRETQLTDDAANLVGVLTYTCRRYEHYDREEPEEVEGALVCTDEKVYKAPFSLAKQLALRVRGSVEYIFGLVSQDSRMNYISTRLGMRIEIFPIVKMLDDASDVLEHKMDTVVSPKEIDLLERMRCLILQLRDINSSLEIFFTTDQSIAVSVDNEKEYKKMQSFGAEFFGVYARRTRLYDETMSIKNFLGESDAKIKRDQNAFRMKYIAFKRWKLLDVPLLVATHTKI